MATTQQSDIRPLDLGDSRDEETTQPTQSDIHEGSDKCGAKKKRRLSSDIWKEFRILSSKPAIAVVFDPRYKFAVLDLSYKKLYGPESLQLAKVKSTLFSLFDEYVQDSTTTNISSCSQGSNTDLHSMQHNEKDSIQSKFFEELEQYKFRDHDGISQKSELELYLEEPTLSRTISLDVLEFWKSQQFKYPDLARLARDVLCVPVSTVASESAFSLGGRILDQYRSSMLPHTVEALTCTRDWLFGGTVMSEVKSDEIVENVIASYFNNEETNLLAAEVTNSNMME